MPQSLYYSSTDACMTEMQIIFHEKTTAGRKKEVNLVKLVKKNRDVHTDWDVSG